MDIDELMRRLFKLYPEGYTDGFREPFFVLISTVMSHRTRDDITYPAARRLFEKLSTPEEMAEADIDEIVALIKDVGFYRVKAGKIKEISGILLEKYMAGFLKILNLSLDFQESVGRQPIVYLPMLSLKTPLQ